MYLVEKKTVFARVATTRPRNGTAVSPLVIFIIDQTAVLVNRRKRFYPILF